MMPVDAVFSGEIMYGKLRIGKGSLVLSTISIFLLSETFGTSTHLGSATRVNDRPDRIIAGNPSELELSLTDPGKHPVSPFDRRLIGKPDSVLKCDVAMDYWFFDMHQNMYSMTPGYLQTGTFGPRVDLNLGRLVAGGHYLYGISWLKSIEEALPDKGSGPMTLLDLHGGVDLHKKLFLEAGYYHFAGMATTEGGMMPSLDFFGPYISVRQLVAVSKSTRHGLSYRINFVPMLTQSKNLAFVGYKSLRLPPATKEGVGFHGTLSYVYSFDLPIQLLTGLKIDYLNSETDVTVLYGPLFSLNAKL